MALLCVFVFFVFSVLNNSARQGVMSVDETARGAAAGNRIMGDRIMGIEMGGCWWSVVSGQ